jgi:glycosyltransferase involved in cell wall biosynthesis
MNEQSFADRFVAPPDTQRSAIRVLHCIPTVHGGGAERQLRLIGPELVRRGIQVAVFSRFTPEDAAEMSEQGIVCLPIRAKGNHNPSLAFEYLDAVRRFRPAIVQSWLAQMDLLCGILPRRGARWVLSERGSALAYGRTGVYPSPFKNWLRHTLGVRSDMVVANSPGGLAIWQGARAQTLIPNGIDLEAIEADTKAHCSQRKPYIGRKIILTVSRLTKGKRTEVLISSAQEIRARIPNILLVILGEGPDRPQLERQIAEAGLNDHVRLEGFRTDVPAWLKSADVFVSASLHEGQPNAVLEAAAAGTPMVLSDIPGHRDTMADGAIYVPVEEPEQFAPTIMRVIDSPALARQVADLARKQVEKASVEAVTGAYVALYQRLSASGLR